MGLQFATRNATANNTGRDLNKHYLRWIGVIGRFDLGYKIKALGVLQRVHNARVSLKHVPVMRGPSAASVGSDVYTLTGGYHGQTADCATT